jgi:hypothetical protein
LNFIALFEAGKLRKEFNEEEVKKIKEGNLDVTQFFENKEESTKRLMDALKGRSVYTSQKEKEEFLQRVKK